MIILCCNFSCLHIIFFSFWIHAITFATHTLDNLLMQIMLDIVSFYILICSYLVLHAEHYPIAEPQLINTLMIIELW